MIITQVLLLPKNLNNQIFGLRLNKISQIKYEVAKLFNSFSYIFSKNKLFKHDKDSSDGYFRKEKLTVLKILSQMLSYRTTNYG